MIHQKEYGIDSNQTHSKKNVAMILYAIYAATVFIYEDFSVPLFVIGIFICIIVLYLLYYHFVNKTKIMVSGTNIYILLLVMCMIANIRTISGIRLIYWIDAVLCVLMIIMASRIHGDLMPVYRITLAFALVFASVVIMGEIYPEMYYSLIYTHLSAESKILVSNALVNYGVIIGGTFTFQLYFFAAGIAIAMGYIECLKKRIIGYTLILTFLIAILCSGRRTEFLAVLVTMILTYCVSSRGKKKAKRVLLSIFICISAVIIFINSFSFFSEIDLLNRYTSSFEDLLHGNDITTGRTQLYGIAWDLFCEHPVFGIGWGGFAAYVPNTAYYFDVSNVHNNYLQLLCETGLVGTIIILFLLLGIYRNTCLHMKAVCKNAYSSERLIEKMGTIFSFFMQTFFFIAGFMDPSLYKVLFWKWYTIALVLELAPYYYNKNAKKNISTMVINQ